jgi:CRP/FNR family transcriptional regulator, nitrogen fixation regulation protein
MSTLSALSTRHPAARAPVLPAGASWERESAGAFAMTGPVLHFTQDREIYGQGDEAKMFFKIVTGVVRTCKFFIDGKRQIDAFHIAGDVFGFETDGEYSLSAEAVSDCTIVAYRHRGLENSAMQNAELSRQLLSSALRNLARAQDHALLLGRKSAVERVAAFLVEWAGHTIDTAMVTLEMSRQDMADYLGLSIETVSRTLSQLERDGVIEFSSLRKIRLADPAALRGFNS